MNALTPEITNNIDALLAALDTDIEQLSKSIEILNQLRALVVRRDENSLHGLLVTIRTDSQKYQHDESRRQSIRALLAKSLGCGSQQVTLTKLRAIAPAEMRSRISDTSEKLRALSGMLKKEYAATAALLTDCARFNRQLLQCILGRSANAVTYNASGSAARRLDAAFMNFEF
jgi:hypothetical protein